jgi:hypothetical protein
MTIYNKSLFQKNGIHELPNTYSTYSRAAAVFKANCKARGLTHKWFGYTEVKEIRLQRIQTKKRVK